MNLIQQLEAEAIEAFRAGKAIPDFRPGDTLRVGVRVVEGGPEGVDLRAALAVLHAIGVRSLLVEGGARVITSFLRERVVDRLVVAIAPTIIGAGKEAVGDLAVTHIADGLRLANRSVHLVGDDLLMAADPRWTG